MNTIITTETGWKLNSCDIDVSKLDIHNDIPTGCRVECPVSGETICKVDTYLAAVSLIADIQSAVRRCESEFDVRIPA